MLLDGVPLPELTPAALHAAVGYGFERPVLVGETVGDAVGASARTRCRWPGPPPSTTSSDGCPTGTAPRWPRSPCPAANGSGSGWPARCGPDGCSILDDATSSLDTATEYQVTQALTGPGDRRTRVVVSHRLGMAARATWSAWVAGGRVRRGRPAPDLWADPDYREVFRS